MHVSALSMHATCTHNKTYTTHIATSHTFGETSYRRSESGQVYYTHVHITIRHTYSYNACVDIVWNFIVVLILVNSFLVAKVKIEH